MRTGILGAGSWGTALAILWSRQGQPVVLWGRDAQKMTQYRQAGCNTRYLPETPFPDKLALTDDFEETVAQSTLLALAVPLQTYRRVLTRLRPHLRDDHRLLLLSKGIELETHMLPSEIVRDVLGEPWADRAFTLAGPSFAREVAEDMPTTVVISGRREEDLTLLQGELNGPRFRLYRNLDLVGVEISAGLKNVIAIASGLVKGLDLGDNAQAGLITRGLAEITRLGVKLGARGETFAGLAGMGDLILTCTGKLSRNLRVGLELAKGKTVEKILEDLGMVAEGVHTCRSAVQLSAAAGVELPIAEAVNQIIYQKMSPQKAVHMLLSRSLKEEGRRAYD